MKAVESVNDRIAARSAELTVQGLKIVDQIPILQAEFQTPLNEMKLSNLRRKPIYKELLKKVREEVIISSIHRIKERMVNLVEKASDVIEFNLDEKSLNAAKMVFESLGIGSKHDVPQVQDQVLQVIMRDYGASHSSEATEIDATTESKTIDSNKKPGDFEADDDGSVSYVGKLED